MIVSAIGPSSDPGRLLGIRAVTTVATNSVEQTKMMNRICFISTTTGEVY
jgi:hypothetical protein